MPEPVKICLPNRNDFLSQVEAISGEKARFCYQCGKCSAGCPVAFATDESPRLLMRGIQLGLKDEVLQSTGIWLCVGCQVCSLRCPKEIDVARIIESLRHLCLKENRAPGEKDVAIAYDAFLQQVRLFDRVYEIGLGLIYNIRSRQPMHNMSLVPKLLAKGKLRLLPYLRGTSKVRSIMQKLVRQGKKVRKT